ncbi:26S proteasome regulatory subunit, ATPase 3, interacting protein, partial [Tremellales sp. Uapishka_1]
MPPKAVSKEKSVKGDEGKSIFTLKWNLPPSSRTDAVDLVAEEMVLNYMKSVNRPYASTDVSANLKGKVAKPLAQKILVTLTEKGSLTQKTYGKQTIFVYNQTLLDVLPTETLADLDGQLKEAQVKVLEKQKELKVLQNDLLTMEMSPKTVDLPNEIEMVKEEIGTSSKLVSQFKGSEDDSVPLSTEEIKKIDENFAKWKKEWINRKKVYKSLFDQLKDGGQVANDGEFQDEQGINLDDEEALEVQGGEFWAEPARVIKRPLPSSSKNAPAPRAFEKKKPVEAKKPIEKRKKQPVVEEEIVVAKLAGKKRSSSWMELESPEDMESQESEVLVVEEVKPKKKGKKERAD